MDQIKKVTKRFRDLAKRQADASQLLVEGVVVSKNPDGSLNVSDGKGGCLRIAPRQNANIGDTIRVGTEPNIGTTTNLPQEVISVDSLTAGCPDDPRLNPPPTPSPPTPPVNQLSFPSSINGSAHFSSYGGSYAAAWADRANIAHCNQDPGAFRGFNNNDGTLFNCERGWLDFDTTGLVPAGAVLYTATLRCYGDFATGFWVGPGTYGVGFSAASPSGWPVWTNTDGVAHIYVSTAPDLSLVGTPLAVSHMNDVDFTRPLGSFRLQDVMDAAISDAGPWLTLAGNPRGAIRIDIPLDVRNFTVNNSGRTKFAIVMDKDSTGTAPGNGDYDYAKIVGFPGRPDIALLLLQFATPAPPPEL
jgi:hypothetical protein